MADESAAADEDVEGESEGAAGGSKKKLFLFGGIGLVVLLAAGRRGLLFSDGVRNADDDA